MSTSDASVPGSIRSILVKTPMVRTPSESTSLASFNESEFAISVLAAVTANTMELGLVMYCKHISRICCSMSAGCGGDGRGGRPLLSPKMREVDQNREHAPHSYLITNRNLGNPRKIYQSQVQDMRRVNLEIDGFRGNAFILPC